MFIQLTSGQGITDWEVIALFHTMSVYQAGVEVLNFKQILKILIDFTGDVDDSPSNRAVDNFGDVDGRRAEQLKVKAPLMNMRIH